MPLAQQRRPLCCCTVALIVSVTSAATTRALFDLEVCGPAGQRVFQQFWDGQTLAAGTASSFTAA